MPQTRNSYTEVLPNGNRVTVTVGSNGRRTRFYKTVSVRRPNGTGDSRTYRRGAITSWLGAYDQSIPKWAKEPIVPAPRNNVQGRVALGADEPSYTDWRVAYEQLQADLLRKLEQIQYQRAADAFVEQGIERLRVVQATVDQFVVVEFLQKFWQKVSERHDGLKTEVLQIVEQTNAQAIEVGTQLETRKRTAEGSNDSDGVHAVWVEVERRRKEFQAEVDAQTERLRLSNLQLEAAKSFVSRGQSI